MPLFILIKDIPTEGIQHLIPLMQIMLRTAGFFIHHTNAGAETVQSVMQRDRMGIACGHEMGKDVTRSRGGFEPPVTPAAIQIEPVDMRLVDDW